MLLGLSQQLHCGQPVSGEHIVPVLWLGLAELFKVLWHLSVICGDNGGVLPSIPISRATQVDLSPLAMVSSPTPTRNKICTPDAPTELRLSEHDVIGPTLQKGWFMEAQTQHQDNNSAILLDTNRAGHQQKMKCWQNVQTLGHQVLFVADQQNKGHIGTEHCPTQKTVRNCNTKRWS